VIAGLSTSWNETLWNVPSMSATLDWQNRAFSEELPLCYRPLSHLIANGTLPVIVDPVLYDTFQDFVVSAVFTERFAKDTPLSICTRHGLAVCGNATFRAGATLDYGKHCTAN